jgi:integrase
VVQLTLDSKSEEFLADAKTEGTRETYRVGLQKFTEFLEKQGFGEEEHHRQGNIEDFLRAADEDNTRRAYEKTHVVRKTLKAFSKSLQAAGLAPNSVRSYLSSIQSLYFHVFEEKLSLQYTDLPDALAQGQKYPWTLETVSRFLATFDDPMYRSLGVLLLQSGLSVSDALNLKWSDLAEFRKACPMLLDFLTKGREKTKTVFLTFVGRATIDLLEVYLAGKTPMPEDRVFPVSKQAVEAYWRVRARRFIEEGWKGRCPASPHSFRSAFKTLCADSKAITEMDVEFFMCHKAKRDLKLVYTSRGLDAWRGTYAKVEPYLTPSLPVKEP